MNVFFEYKGWHFEWDSEKASKNFQKHGISFEDAAIFFYEEESIMEPDYQHCNLEERWNVLGLGNRGRLWSVCVTYRETQIGASSHRIISAREINAKKIPKHRKSIAQRINYKPNDERCTLQSR